MRESFSTLPRSWATPCLEDVVLEPKADIVDGPFGSNLKASEYTEQGIPIIRLQNVKANRFIEKNIRYISPGKAEELKRHGFKAGDIVVSKLGNPLGEACIVPDGLTAGIIVADVVRVRIPEELLDKRAIAYALNSEEVKKQLKALTKGTTRPRVNLSHIREVRIPLPPLKEQSRIVAEIEKQFTRLDAAVVALKRIQTNLKRYRAAVLKAACEGRLVPTEAELAQLEGRSYEPASELLKRVLAERRTRWEAARIDRFRTSDKDPALQDWKSKYTEPATVDASGLTELPAGWEWSTLSQLSEIQGGIQKQPSRRPSQNPHPFLRVANVLRGRLDLSELHDIELFKGELERLRLEVGDLLIVEGNGSATEIGRMAIWNGEINDCVHQNHIIRARLLGVIPPAYVSTYWNSSEGASRVLEVASSTSGLYTLSVSKVGRLPVPLPPAAEQQRIVNEVERRLSVIDELETQVEMNLKRAGRMHQGILKEAFEGRLVPQDPNEEPADRLLAKIRAHRQSAQFLSWTPESTSKGGQERNMPSIDKTSRKSILEVLRASSEPLSPKDLFSKADYEQETVDDFYAALKEEVRAGRIREIRSDNETIRIQAVIQ